MEPFLLVSTLRVAVGQRLVRKLADDKIPYKLSKAERDELQEKVDLDKILESLKGEGVIKKDATWNDVDFFRPKEKGKTEDGYHGRMGIHEVIEMLNSDGVAPSLRKEIEYLEEQFYSSQREIEELRGRSLWQRILNK